MADMYSDTPAWMGSPLGWVGNTQGAARFQEGMQFGARFALMKQEMQLREQAQATQMAEQGLRMQALRQKMREDLEASLETSAMFQQTGGDPWKVLNTVPQSDNPQTLQNWNRAQGMAANTAVAQSALGEINQFKVDVEKLPNRVRAAQIRAMPVGQDGRPSAAQLQALQDAQAEQMEKQIVNRTQLKQMGETYRKQGMRPTMRFNEEGNVTGLTVEPPLASESTLTAQQKNARDIEALTTKADAARAAGNEADARMFEREADTLKQMIPGMREDLSSSEQVQDETLKGQINALSVAIRNAGAKDVPGLLKEQKALEAQRIALRRNKPAIGQSATAKAKPTDAPTPPIVPERVPNQWYKTPKGIFRWLGDGWSDQ